MKKLICILFTFIVLISFSFADKSRFYENGKVIDTMYVDSKDGLKVRDKPSLKSNRLCGLTHRHRVKIVAIGKEETIDGITAPWVEILLPRYEWKTFEAEYGWVFGGYLSKKRKAFSIKNWADVDLVKYISRWPWVENCGDIQRSILYFEENGDFKMRIEEAAGGASGSWTLDFKELQITTNAAIEYPGDEDYAPEYYSTGYDIEKIDEYYFSANGKLYIPYCQWGIISCEDRYSNPDNDSGQFNRDLMDFKFLFNCAESAFNSIYRKHTKLKEQFIKYGIYNSKDKEYLESYREYWDPIMEEHQKKADNLK